MSSGEQATRCRSCGAPVLWRAHETTNRLAPIDAAPTERGNLVLLELDRYGYATAVALVEGVPRYVSHYATCPQREDWRRLRAAKAG